MALFISCKMPIIIDFKNVKNNYCIIQKVENPSGIVIKFSLDIIEYFYLLCIFFKMN